MKINHLLADDPLHNVRFEESLAARDVRPVEEASKLGWNLNILSRRRCAEDDNTGKCEKPQGSNALPIILGTA